MCRRNIAVEAITKVSYNDHGDKSEERVTVGPNLASVGFSIQADGTLRPSGPVRDNTPPELSCGMKYLHTYEYRGYDEYENWTETTKVRKIGPEEYVTNSRRTLTYHGEVLRFKKPLPASLHSLECTKPLCQRRRSQAHAQRNLSTVAFPEDRPRKTNGLPMMSKPLGNH